MNSSPIKTAGQLSSADSTEVAQAISVDFNWANIPPVKTWPEKTWRDFVEPFNQAAQQGDLIAMKGILHAINETSPFYNLMIVSHRQRCILDDSIVNSMGPAKRQEIVECMKWLSKIADRKSAEKMYYIDEIISQAEDELLKIVEKVMGDWFYYPPHNVHAFCVQIMDVCLNHFSNYIPRIPQKKLTTQVLFGIAQRCLIEQAYNNSRETQAETVNRQNLLKTCVNYGFIDLITDSLAIDALPLLYDFLRTDDADGFFKHAARNTRKQGKTEKTHMVEEIFYTRKIFGEYLRKQGENPAESVNLKVIQAIIYLEAVQQLEQELPIEYYV